MTKSIYRITDEQEAARLQELMNVENPTSLEWELAVARHLLEKALNAGDADACLRAINSLTKMSQVTCAAQFKRGDLLAKSAILNLAGKMVEVLAQSVQGRFPGWEDTVDGVRREMLTLVCEAKNPDPNGD